MNRIITGKIKDVYPSQRLITIEMNKRLMYFYLQRGMMNRFNNYLNEGIFISFKITGETRTYLGVTVYQIEYVIKLIYPNYRRNRVLYDVSLVKKGIGSLLNDLDYKLFLDMEMSMHPYYKDLDFKQEIIQVGLCLVDRNDEVIIKYNEIIKPTLFPVLTKRTLKFLTITQEDVDHGIPFTEFYEYFKDVLLTYRPAIIVWGKNDIIQLNHAYNTYGLEKLTKRSNFINLLTVYKNYFNLKDDKGLFKAYEELVGSIDTQTHNALEDAVITKEVFVHFKRMINKG